MVGSYISLQLRFGPFTASLADPVTDASFSYNSYHLAPPGTTLDWPGRPGKVQRSSVSVCTNNHPNTNRLPLTLCHQSLLWHWEFWTSGREFIAIHNRFEFKATPNLNVDFLPFLSVSLGCFLSFRLIFDRFLNVSETINWALGSSSAIQLCGSLSIFDWRDSVMASLCVPEPDTVSNSGWLIAWLGTQARCCYGLNTMSSVL